MAGQVHRHIFIIFVVSVLYHYCFCETGKCSVPPAEFKDKSVSADAVHLLNIPDLDSAACIQQCCNLTGSCSAVLYRESDKTCTLIECPSAGQCEGDDLPGVTLYLLHIPQQTDLHHNHIRQLDDPNTTTTTTGTTATSAPITSTITTTSAAPTSPENIETTTSGEVVTTAAPSSTTLAPVSPGTTKEVHTTRYTTNPATTESPTPNQADSTEAPNTTTLPASNQDASSQTPLPSPPPDTASSTPAAEEASPTSRTLNPSTTQISSSDAVLTDASPKANISKTSSPANDTQAPPERTGMVIDNKTPSAEKRLRSRGWRRSHFQEHLPVKGAFDQSLDLSHALEKIFGDGGVGDGDGDDKNGDGFGFGDETNGDYFNVDDGVDVGDGVDVDDGKAGDGYVELSKTNSRHWGVQGKPDRLHHKPQSPNHRFNSAEDDARKFPMKFPVPYRQPHRLPNLTPHRLPSYPIPHKIAPGKTSNLKEETTEQPGATSPTTSSGTPVPSSPPVSESANTTTTAPPSQTPASTNDSAGSTETNPSGTETPVAVVTDDATETPGTTSPSEVETTETTVKITTNVPNTVATEAPSSSISDTGTTTSGVITSTESTTPESMETTPLLSANDTLADLAIEANDRAISAALIAALSFGVLFFAAVVVLLTKRLYDGWQRRHYSRVDYLVNGMYN